MRCPRCNARMQCRDTASDGNRTGRRYRCPSCNSIYYSEEVLLSADEEVKALSVLSEKSRKKYSRSKLKKSKNCIDKNERL